MAVDFSDFSPSTTIPTSAYFVGYEKNESGGERKWTYGTLRSELSAQIIPSGVTSTEIGYLDGVTSSIQTQLNGKVNDAGGIVNSVAKWSTANTITDSSITFDGDNVKVEAGKFLYAYGKVAGGSQRNIAFGGALTHLTTTGGNDPDHNTAIGALAGHNLQNGSYNTFVGTGAGYWPTATSTSGDKGGNTLVGAYAGFQLDASSTVDRADSNTVVGAFSLSTPGGSDPNHTFRAHGNTVIGHNALSNCTPGGAGGELYERNVMIGQFAGGNLTDGANNCIHIGYNLVGVATAKNNICRIGNSGMAETHITGIYGKGDLGQTVTINANDRLGSISSSLRYKKDIETAEVEYSENIIYNSRPVYYRPKTVSEEHREGWSYWGFIAEELAELDPRMVYWAHKPEDYEEYVSYVDSRTGEEARDRRVKEGAERVPDSIFYERFTVHLVKVAQKQKQEIEELKSTVQQLKAGNEALEARLQALEAK
jgi:hypothetical protein